jgi:hypothetical protein
MKSFQKKQVVCDGPCGQDITHDIQVYPGDGRTLCERCNWLEGDNEDNEEDPN